MVTTSRIRRGGAAPSAAVVRRRVPALVTGTTLMLGIWLVLAPILWTYGDTGGGFDARLNDIVTGVAVTVVSVARLSGRVPSRTVTVAGLLLGGWLILAPVVLEYGLGADSTRATVNDVVVGVGLAVLALAHLGAWSRLEIGGAAR